MDIRSYPGTIGSAAAKMASTVYGYVGGFGKTALEKCGSIAGKVGEIAKRLIPSFVSNTAQAYPKSFCAVSTVVGLSIAAVAFRVFAKGNGSTKE